jgi:hypothetical protein
VSIKFFHINLQKARKAYKIQVFLDFSCRILTFGLTSNKKHLEKAKDDLTSKLAEYFRYQQIHNRTELLNSLPSIEFLEGIRLGQDTNSDIAVIGREDYGSDWEIIRQAILLRDNYQCNESDGYCSGVLQVHHIISLSKGGTNQSFNLVTLCFYHHSLKHEHMKSKL